MFGTLGAVGNLVDSAVKLADDIGIIAVAPVQVAVDVARLHTAPAAVAAELVADGVKNLAEIANEEIGRKK